MGERTGLVAAVVLALLTFVALAAPDFGVGLDDGTAFDQSEPAVTQVLGPALGAPGGPGWLGSTVLSRLALAVPVGGPARRLGALAVAAGLLAVALTYLVYRRLALSVPMSFLGALVTATAGTTLALVTAGSVDALLLPCVPGALLLGWSVAERPPSGWLLLGGWTALLAVMVGSYPSLLPVVACATLAVAGRPGAARRTPVVLATMAGLVFGFAHRWLAVLAAAPESTASLWWTPVVVGTPRGEGRLAALGNLLPGELGLVGILLALVGLATVGRSERGRGAAWAWVAAVLVLVGWASPVPSAGSLVVVLLSWVLVGAGLDWLWRSSRTVAASGGILALGGFLVLVGIADHLTGIHWAARLVGPVMVERIHAAVPPAAGLVAARPSLDRALALRPAELRRLPLDASTLKQHSAAGVQVFALDRARRLLGDLGLQFETLAVPPLRVSVERLLDALPRGTVVAVAGGAGLARSVSPGGAPLFGQIGGTEDLFGDTPFYAAIGVARREGVALERRSSDPFALGVAVGDDVGSFPVRATAALAVHAGAGGISIEREGVTVARAAAGLALAALAPDGQLLATISDELDQGLSLAFPVEPSGLGRLVGAEPCLSVGAGEWVDVRSVAASGRLGVSLLPGASLLVHASSRTDRPPDGDGGRPFWGRLYPVRPDAGAQLEQMLAADQTPFATDLAGAPAIRRLLVETPGSTVLALGEPPSLAYARYRPPSGAPTPLEVCGALSGARRFDRGDPEVTAVAMAELDTVGWGWHGLERDGDVPFRWSDGPEAGLLLQLVRTGDTLVEAVASSAGVDLTGEAVSLTLLVNGNELAPVEMAPGVQRYQWSAPARVWRPGMNRLEMRLSASVNPAELGTSDDRRNLGLALRELGLRLEDPGSPTP